MKHSILKLSIAAALGVLSIGVNQAYAACNTACLNKQMDSYLKQIVKHDPAPLKLTDNLVAVENAKPVKLGEGSWQTIQSLAPYGQTFADASTGQVAYYGATHQTDGKIASLFVRLKIVDNQIAESEMFTKGAYTAEGMETAGLLDPDILYTAVVPKERRTSREGMIKIVDSYLEGISQHNGSLFPASERCDRYQAGSKFTNNFKRPEGTGGGTCQSSMSGLKGQAVVNRRFPIVDEQLGIVVVLFIIPHAERTPQGSTNVAEVFKLVDGKVRSIEEFSFVSGYPPNSGFADASN